MLTRSSDSVIIVKLLVFLWDPGVPGVRSLGPISQTTRGFVDLTDVTLADKDTNSIPTDYVNKTMPGIRQYGNASGATWWSYLKIMRVATF